MTRANRTRQSQQAQPATLIQVPESDESATRFEANIQFTIDDMVAIASTDLADGLRTRIEALSDEIKTLNKELSEIQLKIDAEAESAARVEEDRILLAMGTLLGALNLQRADDEDEDYGSRTTLASEQKSNKSIHHFWNFHCSGTFFCADSKLVRSRHKDVVNHAQAQLTYSRRLEINQATKDLIEAKNNLQAQVAKLTEHSVRLRSELTDLPAFERKAKAAMAKQKLSRTTQGTLAVSGLSDLAAGKLQQLDAKKPSLLSHSK